MVFFVFKNKNEIKIIAEGATKQNLIAPSAKNSFTY